MSAEEFGVEDLGRVAGMVNAGIKPIERLGVAFFCFVVVVGISVGYHIHTREDRARDRVFFGEQIDKVAKAQREDRTELIKMLEKQTGVLEQIKEQLHRSGGQKDRR